VLPGHRYGYPTFHRRGKPLEHPINARYPWRLAPKLKATEAYGPLCVLKTADVRQPSELLTID
jgi:hypothetical protein